MSTTISKNTLSLRGSTLDVKIRANILHLHKTRVIDSKQWSDISCNVILLFLLQGHATIFGWDSDENGTSSKCMRGRRL